MENVTDPVKNYAASLDEDTEETTYDQMKHVYHLLDEDIRRMEKELGQDTEITQPQSALRALVLVLDVLEDQAGEQARPSIRMVRSTYQNGRGTKPDQVHLSFDLVFFASGQLAATQAFEGFIHGLEKEPWFVSYEDKTHEPLEGEKGLFIQGLGVNVDVSKAPPPEPAAPKG
jgi:hypothetical protein